MPFCATLLQVAAAAVLTASVTAAVVTSTGCICTCVTRCNAVFTRSLLSYLSLHTRNINSVSVCTCDTAHYRRPLIALCNSHTYVTFVAKAVHSPFTDVPAWERSNASFWDPVYRDMLWVMDTGLSNITVEVILALANDVCGRAHPRAALVHS